MSKKQLLKRAINERNELLSDTEVAIRTIILDNPLDASQGYRLDINNEKLELLFGWVQQLHDDGSLSPKMIKMMDGWFPCIMPCVVSQDIRQCRGDQMVETLKKIQIMCGWDLY